MYLPHGPLGNGVAVNATPAVILTFVRFWLSKGIFMLTKEQIALLSPEHREAMALEYSKQVFWECVLAAQADAANESWATGWRHATNAHKAQEMVVLLSS